MPQTIQKSHKWCNNDMLRVCRWQLKTKAIKPRIKIIPYVKESPDKTKTPMKGSGNGTRGRKSKEKEKVEDPDNEYRIYLICKEKENDTKSMLFRILYSGGVKGEGVSPSVKFENQIVNPIIPLGFVRKTTHFFLMIIRHDIRLNTKSMMYTNYFRVLNATDFKEMGIDVNNIDYESKSNLLAPKPSVAVLQTWFSFLTEANIWSDYYDNRLFPSTRDNEALNEDDVGSGDLSEESSEEYSYNNSNNNSNIINDNNQTNNSTLYHLDPLPVHSSTEVSNTNNLMHSGQNNFEENPFLQIPLHTTSSNHGIFGDPLSNQGVLHHRDNVFHFEQAELPYNHNHNHTHTYQHTTPFHDNNFSNHHLNEDLFGTLREFEMSERRGAMNTTLDHMKEQTLYMKETRRFMINFNNFFELYFNNGSDVNVLDEDYIKALERSVIEEREMIENMKIKLKKRKL